MARKENVLVVAAHPDDEAYGPGATISYMSYLKYWEVYVLTLTNGCNVPKDSPEENLKKLRQSCNNLGVKENYCANLDDQRLDSYDLNRITGLIKEKIDHVHPEIVLTHNITDLNRDHRLVSEATMVACRPVPYFSVRELWMYEIPSSTDWGFGQFGSFEPNLFFEVHPKFWHIKFDSIKMYPNELKDYPHARSLGQCLDKLAHRGRSVGAEYAEAFKLVWKKAGPIHERSRYI